MQVLMTDEMKVPILTAVIKSTAAEWVREGQVSDVKHINGGYCEDFASQVMMSPWLITNGLFGIQLLHSEEFKVEGQWDWELLKEWGVAPPKGFTPEECNIIFTGEHTFMVFAKQFFDSECPQGAISFFDLPFYQRYLQKIT